MLECMLTRFRGSPRPYWLAAALFIALVSCDSKDNESQSRKDTYKHIKFAQLTDPHFFDTGKARKDQMPDEAEKEAGETLKAFQWAAKQLSEEPENQGLDFVVITGDFGLEMVPISLREEAAKYLAEELAKLTTVGTILVVPGNNDLVNERSEYIDVYNAFVEEVAKISKNKIVNLIKGPYPSPLGGLIVVGLESSTFKNTECGATSKAARCVAQYTYQKKEMNRVGRKPSEGKDTPTIVFTHIPDLYDPFEFDKGRIVQSWVLDEDTWKTWDDNKFEAVFAGHFHSGEKKDYGQPSHLIPTVHPPKHKRNQKPAFVVCPPLASKFDKKAQGYLIGEIDMSKRIVEYRIIYMDAPKNPILGKVAY